MNARAVCSLPHFDSEEEDAAGTPNGIGIKTELCSPSCHNIFTSSKTNTIRPATSAIITQSFTTPVCETSVIIK
jgi:hypothetical protein